MSPNSHIPEEGNCFQSTSPSPPLWNTPPHPQFSRPLVHNDSSPGAPPSQSPSVLPVSGLSFRTWIASWPHPHSESISGSHSPHRGTGMQILAPGGPCHPPGVPWWQDDSDAHTHPGKIVHQIHHAQFIDPTSPNYFVYHPAQGLSCPEFLYPPFLSCPLTTPQFSAPFQNDQALRLH